MKKSLIIISLLGMLVVILGAFGAHGLSGKISPDSLAAYKTGVMYHFIHTIVALVVWLLYSSKPSKWLALSMTSFLVGVFLFSGSIYLLSTNEVTHIGIKSILGPLTPIGGIFFILGWLFLMIFSININKK